jgi:hypothetical protein
MRPTGLTTVAALYIAQGVGSTVTIVVGSFEGRTIIDLGAIALIVGIGLLRRSVGARRLALAWTVLALLAVLIAGVARFWRPAQDLSVQIFGVRLSSVPLPEFLGAIVSVFLTTSVELWLLVSREVRAAFAQKSDPPATMTAAMS